MVGLTDGEMRTLYMDAKDRREIINILAQLTLSTPRDIIDWLVVKGLPLPERRGVIDRMGRYNAGLSDKDIAQLEGITASAVRDWRKRRGLPANRKAGRPRKGDAK